MTDRASSPTFDDLVTEAAAVDVSGWDFSWLDGRATEQRPSWGYQRLLVARMAAASASLDLDTGGGEVLAAATAVPPLAVATEAWPPNLARAQALLKPLGVVVVGADAAEPLPFADRTFDLVTSRHPVDVHWAEVARVLTPGGTYFAQHVGPDSAHEVSEYFLGAFPWGESGREPELARSGAEAAGLEVVDLRAEDLRMEFFDIGAMVYYLRKVIWMVPDFSVEKYRPRLRELHEQIQDQGSFVSTVRRFLIEARKA